MATKADLLFHQGHKLEVRTLDTLVWIHCVDCGCIVVDGTDENQLEESENNA
jgi:hypothetical protein